MPEVVPASDAVKSQNGKTQVRQAFLLFMLHACYKYRGSGQLERSHTACLTAMPECLLRGKLSVGEKH